MYAVIETGSKQYTVKENDIITVEKLDVKEGDSVGFPKVLLYVNDKRTLMGTPHLNNVSVEGKLLDQTRDRKIRIFKYKKRKKYRVRKGHRQDISMVQITRISAGE